MPFVGPTERLAEKKGAKLNRRFEVIGLKREARLAGIAKMVSLP
jgi:hypothetical protein